MIEAEKIYEDFISRRAVRGYLQDKLSYWILSLSTKYLNKIQLTFFNSSNTPVKEESIPAHKSNLFSLIRKYDLRYSPPSLKGHVC